jgi:hypothetical protein
MLRTKLQSFLKVKTNLRISERLRCLVIGNETTDTKPSGDQQQKHHVHKLQFNNSRLATETKSFSDIVRALVILKLCTIEALVDNSEKVWVVFTCITFYSYLNINPSFVASLGIKGANRSIIGGGPYSYIRVHTL